jgi:hypothetical protein
MNLNKYYNSIYVSVQRKENETEELIFICEKEEQ